MSYRHLLLAPLAACAVDAATVDEPAYTDTAVVIAADGTITQATQAVTAAQREAQLARPEGPTGRRTVDRARLTVDASCATADLWLYDAAQGSRLCIASESLGFNQSATLDLHTVRFGTICLRDVINGPCINWAGRVGWMWPGVDNGFLYPSIGASPSYSIVANGPLQTVDPAVSNVVFLYGPLLH